MKEEALKLADDLEELHEQDLIDGVAHLSMPQASAMIRRLVEELDYLKDQISFYEIKNLDSGIIGKIGDCNIHDLVHRTKPQTKPLNDEEIEYYEHLIAKLFNCSVTQKVVGLDRVIRAIEERHGIK